MPDAVEQTQEQLDAEWPHICAVLEIQRVPSSLATLIKETMRLAAAKERVDLNAPEDWQRKSARRRALLAIFGSYDGRPDRG
jgi:hypothetical protein